MVKDNYEGPILEIENLSISFFTRSGEIPAVMDFSCTVMPGEAMGLVGESGCGKSTVALGVMQDLGVNGRIVGGSIKFKGKDLSKMTPAELRHIRGNEIAMIYQEPMASLNPAMEIGKQLMEVPMLHAGANKEEARRLALEVVEAVRLPDPERILGSYPHQLSGGQQQRIVIAMALMAQPSLLILDEPTTALDVTVQAQILEVIERVQERFGTAVVLITHDLGVVAEICDRVIVMYAGGILEAGSVENILEHPLHPYTQGLLKAIPQIDKQLDYLNIIPGSVPDLKELKNMAGCCFEPRCSKAMDICKQTTPLVYTPRDNHCVNCHLYNR